MSTGANKRRLLTYLLENVNDARKSDVFPLKRIAHTAYIVW